MQQPQQRSERRRPEQSVYGGGPGRALYGEQAGGAHHGGTCAFAQRDDAYDPASWQRQLEDSAVGIVSWALRR